MSTESGLFHRFVENPAIYDLIQSLAGSRWSRPRLARAIANYAPQRGMGALDMGGGTASAQSLFPAEVVYRSLDSDPAKVRAAAARNPDGLLVQADATRPPVRTASLDVVLCRAVSHHLTDAQVDALFVECARVLAPGGVLVFLDAVKSGRVPGRLLWMLDRGSFPRPQDQLEAALRPHFDIVHEEEFAIWHRYVLWVAKPMISGA